MRAATPNPLVEAPRTPLGTPPFHRVEKQHFEAALTDALQRYRDTVEAIAKDPAPAQFDNSILALEEAEEELARLVALLLGLAQVQPEPEWRELATDLSAKVAAELARVRGEPALKQRIQSVLDDPDHELDDQQVRLGRLTLKRLHHGGAGLDQDQRRQLARKEGELTELAMTFQHRLAQASRRYALLVEDRDRVADLPDSLLAQARQDAADRGHDSGWAFTLHAHSLFPFLTHSSQRELRREIYQAWQRRAGSWQDGRAEDNGELMQRMTRLRSERAQLLGYDHHLDLVMAKGSIQGLEALETLLDQVEAAARPAAEAELAAIRAAMVADGIDDEPQPWDWWYYEHRLGEPDNEFDDDTLRAWFALPQVRDGAFAMANRLFGLSFRERTDLPRWHPSVEAWAVEDQVGQALGVIYLDLVHRSGKAGGAWMSVYRSRHESGDALVPAVVANVANFQQAHGETEALLAPEEVQTLFHEFGHALHALLSSARYRSLSGPSVAEDFIEFPALLLERWAFAPELLRQYAFHHQTGAMMETGMIEALQGRQRQMAGLRTLQQVAAIRIDMAWHAVGPDEELDPDTMESRVISTMTLPDIVSLHHGFDAYRSFYAGQRGGREYRLLWADVLAADAFALFREQGLFNRELADRFRTEVLAPGNGRDPMTSWASFRGRAPDAAAWLNERGLDSD